MSKIEKTLEIFPPALMTFTTRKESFLSDGHTCPYCNGTGIVRGFQTGLSDNWIDVCPICEGGRCLRARVNVVWEPYNEDNVKK